jgi:hypothetical protein
MKSTIRRILKEITSKLSLPIKPDNHLFNDEWLSKFNTDGEYIKLYHYGPSGLDYLDPKYFGKHSYTDSEKWWGRNRIFFYTDIKQQERIVGGSLYEAKIKLSDLYPFNKDPLNLYDIAIKEYGYDNIPIRRQVIYISNYLQKMGYRGMIYKWVGNELIAVIWDNVSEIVEITKPPKKELKLPVSDKIGWPIVDGLSTDPNISTEDKIKRVVEAMIYSNYPKEFIDEYLRRFEG